MSINVPYLVINFKVFTLRQNKSNLNFSAVKKISKTQSYLGNGWFLGYHWTLKNCQCLKKTVKTSNDGRACGVCQVRLKTDWTALSRSPVVQKLRVRCRSACTYSNSTVYITSKRGNQVAHLERKQAGNRGGLAACREGLSSICKCVDFCGHNMLKSVLCTMCTITAPAIEVF